MIDDEEAEAAEKAAKAALDADAPWNAPDEDPPPGTAGEDAEPELDAEGNPVERPAPVDYKGIAKRLAMATTPAEGEDEVDHLKLVCDACDDIRALDIVAKDGYDELASKIKYFRVVELLFRHLRAMPAPLPPTPEPELDDEASRSSPGGGRQGERASRRGGAEGGEGRRFAPMDGGVAAPGRRAPVSVPGAIRREVPTLRTPGLRAVRPGAARRETRPRFPTSRSGCLTQPRGPSFAAAVAAAAAAARRCPAPRACSCMCAGAAAQDRRSWRRRRGRRRSYKRKRRRGRVRPRRAAAASAQRVAAKAAPHRPGAVAVARARIPWWARGRHKRGEFAGGAPRRREGARRRDKDRDEEAGEGRGGTGGYPEGGAALRHETPDARGPRG